MKMQLLTVSIFLFIVNCCSRGNESIQIDDYVFCSLYKFGQQIEMDKNTDVIYNIKNSKKIKGPVIGMDIKTLILVNKTIIVHTFLTLYYRQTFSISAS